MPHKYFGADLPGSGWFQSAFIAVVCLTLKALRARLASQVFQSAFIAVVCLTQQVPFAKLLKTFQSAFIAVVCLTDRGEYDKLPPEFVSIRFHRGRVPHFESELLQ